MNSNNFFNSFFLFKFSLVSSGKLEEPDTLIVVAHLRTDQDRQIQVATMLCEQRYTLFRAVLMKKQGF